MLKIEYDTIDFQKLREEVTQTAVSQSVRKGFKTWVEAPGNDGFFGRFRRGNVERYGWRERSPKYNKFKMWGRSKARPNKKRGFAIANIFTGDTMKMIQETGKIKVNKYKGFVEYSYKLPAYSKIRRRDANAIMPYKEIARWYAGERELIVSETVREMKAKIQRALERSMRRRRTA
jgi:hypothetical protein